MPEKGASLIPVGFKVHLLLISKKWTIARDSFPILDQHCITIVGKKDLFMRYLSEFFWMLSFILHNY